MYRHLFHILDRANKLRQKERWQQQRRGNEDSRPSRENQNAIGKQPMRLQPALSISPPSPILCPPLFLFLFTEPPRFSSQPRNDFLLQRTELLVLQPLQLVMLS